MPMSKGRRQLDLVIIHTRIRITGRFKGSLAPVRAQVAKRAERAQLLVIHDNYSRSSLVHTVLIIQVV